MKVFSLFILILFTYNQLNAQSPNANYDSVLAKKLNANSNGMKRYYLVILKTGPVTIPDKTKLDSIFSGHMKNIGELASKNKLAVAGPLGKNDKSYRGIFILNTESKDEAEKLVESDPAVQAKVLAAEYYPLFASAALMQTLEIHKKIVKINP